MYKLLRSSKKHAIKLIVICVLLVSVLNQQTYGQAKSKSAQRPLPPKSVMLQRITPHHKNTASLAPLASSLYVNDASTVGDQYTTAAGSDANAGTAAAPFATIQHAIDVAQDGDFIFVDAGTYIEDLTLYKTLSIRGVNYAINPNTGTRSAESIIQPFTSDIVYGIILYLNSDASNSTIDGFTFDGDNSTSEAISAYEGIAYVQVSNNIVKSTTYTGVDFDNYYSGGAATTGNLITNNKFDNITPSSYGIGVLIYDNAYTSITNNVMTAVNIGVQTGNFYNADPSGSHTISGNTIESAVVGIWHNLVYSGASTFNITGNNITTYAGSTINDGIEISSIQQTVGVNITNNNVTGAKNGIDLWSCPTTNTVTINGGTLSNCEVGVLPNNYYGYSSNAQSSAYIVNGVNIQNAAVAGIYVQDDNQNTSNATVSLQIKGGTVINNTTTGLKIEGGDASASFSGANAASFTSQSVYINQVSNGTNPPSANIDATNVSFDGLSNGSISTAQGFVIEDKINHKPDYSALGLVTFKTNNVFVTTNSFISPLTTSASIQRGIDASSNGWTVNVNAGTYSESVTVNKQVTIKGVQAGVLGKGRSGPETIVDPNSALAHGFNVVTDNVTIDGFTITNTAAYPSSERYGVVTISKIGTGNFTGIAVKNNIISRQFKAVNFNYTDNFEISGNWLHGENDDYNYGCTWVSSYGTSSSTGLMTNNDLDGYNSAIEIQGNSAQPVSNITISENRSTGSQYVLIGLQNSTVYRNSVLNVTVGSHIYIGGGCSGDTFSENFFDGGISNGVRIANDFGAGVNSNLTITNNSITGHNTSGKYEISVDASAYTGTLSATCNWYGTNDDAVIAPKISGPVTYKPYLFDGTDNGAAPGFQPTSSCAQPLVVSLGSKSNVSCFGQHDGLIDINVTGGSGSYTYNWSNGKTTQDIKKLGAGTYTVTVTDATYSTATAMLSVTITEPLLLDMTASSQANEKCNGDANGSFSVDATGGTTPYKYSFEGSAFSNKKTFKNLAAGTYTVVVKDAHDCTKTIMVEITQPSALMLTATHKDVKCSDPNSGSITASASGGTPGYTYKLIETNQTSANGKFFNLAAGTYTVQVKDANKCTKTITVTINPCGAIASLPDGSAANATASLLEAKLLPNPTTTEFTLILNGNSKEPVEIRVADMYGKNVYQIKGSANGTYHFGQQFISGAYVVQVIQGAQIKTLKAIKGK